jgi:superfamily II DNA or RNA helicase
MNLENYGFKHHYDHVLGEEMLEEFYVPMLKNSNTYDRVAGYFSSAVLSHASAGFAEFCKSPNPRGPIPKFRLIVGARLNPKDEVVILHMNDPGLVQKDFEKIILKNIENLDEQVDFDRNRLKGLAWMIKNNLLEIKVGALYDPETNEVLPHNEAEFHSKFGIASDGKNTIYFGGSANETKRAWLKNYETIDVSRSWAGDESRKNISTYKGKFEALWNNERRNQGVVVVDFPHAAKNKILDKFPPSDPRGRDEVDEVKQRKQYLHENVHGKGEKWNENYTDISRWSHQEQAVDWFLDSEQADGVGLLQMATGSGKTWTSIKAIRKSINEGIVNKSVICVPKTLENQWEDVLDDKLPNGDPLYPEYGNLYWYRSGEKQFKNFFADNKKHSVLIVSEYFWKDLFQFAKNNSSKVTDTILVVDELHHLGSEGYKQTLIDKNNPERVSRSYDHSELKHFSLRLGLSATPWSPYDNERNRYIVNGFVNGDFKITNDLDVWQKKLIDEKRVFNFGLKEGIEKGILCPFNYLPLDYDLSDTDIECRKNAWKKIPPNLPPNKAKEWGMRESAKCLKLSKEKIPHFRIWLSDLLKSGKSLNRTIIFVEEKKYGDEISSILSREFSITNFRTYYEGEPFITLEKFAEGKSSFNPQGLDAIIACKRISEGIDIKSVDTIIIFSADNNRLQTIQRIGRALRTDKDNPDKIATIIDFISVDLDELGERRDETSDMRRKRWLTDLAKVRRN